LSVPAEATRAPARESMLKFRTGVPSELGAPVELRKISLRRLEEAAAAAGKPHPENLPDDLRFFGGIQRIQYILLYPEDGDIVLAGPGEGWKVDDDVNIVGVTTGRPVLRLEDFVVALRTADIARQGGISVSIDPTAEGRQRLDAFLAKQSTYSSSVLTGVKNALGMQQITVTGAPANSHFARVLVASDFHMKRIAMKLDPSPLKELPSFPDLLKTTNAQLDNMMPRWWMACDYQPLGKSADGLAYELRGPGVKVLTEDEVVAGGNVSGTGKANPVAQKWADLMSEHFDELSAKKPVFGELRNVMDMCVIAALIAKEDLLTKANCKLPTLLGETGNFQVLEWNVPKTVETQTSSLKRGREYIITASGGVDINSWQVADRLEVRPEVSAIRAKAQIAKNAPHPWSN
jgi:hypothetical protein